MDPAPDQNPLRDQQPDLEQPLHQHEAADTGQTQGHYTPLVTPQLSHVPAHSTDPGPVKYSTPAHEPPTVTTDANLINTFILMEH